MAVIKTNPKDYRPGDWAVWPYDLYPHFLCGEITDQMPQGWAPRPMVDDSGAVWVKGYSSYFKPKVVVDAETGKALRELEIRLASEMAQATGLLRKEMVERRDKAFAGLDLPANVVAR